MIDFPAIEKEVHRMDSGLAVWNESFIAATVLLSATQVGPHLRSIFHFTGYRKNQLAKIRKFFKRWEQNGVFKDGVIYHGGWFDERCGGVAFWLDVGVGTGMLQRVDDENEG